MLSLENSFSHHIQTTKEDVTLEVQIVEMRKKFAMKTKTDPEDQTDIEFHLKLFLWFDPCLVK